MLYEPLMSIGSKVAPLAGAWIEISTLIQIVYIVVVAPLAGAWIEISIRRLMITLWLVAPLAGAWIEIHLLVYGDYRMESLLSQERGLK